MVEKLNPDDPQSFFTEHFSLPPLPAVVERLISALQSGDTNATEVGELLASDPGLMAQIMKIVNSAYYGLPRPIRDVRHAVAYLGLAEVHRVALTVSVMDKLVPEDTEAFEQFWYHSFHTALCAKYIASRYETDCSVEELHVSALLHDVGKLIYLKYFPEAYGRLNAYATEHDVSLSRAEAVLEMPTHSEFGATLCERWRLPNSVRQACLRHELEDLVEGKLNDELRVVCMANLLSSLSTVELGDQRKTDIRDAAMSALDCSEDEFLLLMGELYEKRAEVQRFLANL